MCFWLIWSLMALYSAQSVLDRIYTAPVDRGTLIPVIYRLQHREEETVGTQERLVSLDCCECFIFVLRI